MKHVETSKDHIPALDGVRGVAIILVMLYHFQPQIGVSPVITSFVSSAASFGYVGVDLFFALSGFLITGILLRNKGSEGYFSNFYVRRVLRIFPLYYGTLLALYFLAPLIKLTLGLSTAPPWWYWMYLQNIGDTFTEGGIKGPAHFWSLAVEEHFYLFWPLIVYWCSPRRLLKVLLVIIGISILSRAVLLQLDYSVATFTLCRLDALALGAILAVLLPKLTPTNLKRIASCVIISTLFVLAAYGLLIGFGPQWAAVLKYTVTSLVCSCLLFLALTTSVVRKIFSISVLRIFGKYSYALYVFHPFALNAFMREPSRRGIAELIIYFLLNLVLALLSWHLFEKYFLRLKRRFPSKPLPVGRPAVTPKIEEAQLSGQRA